MGLLIGAWRAMMIVKDALVLLFLLLFFGLVYMALSATPNAGSVREGALVLNLNGTIAETMPVQSVGDVINGGGSGRVFLLRDLVRGLDAAAADDRVRAVVVDLSGFGGGGQVELERLGQALDGVRKAKKRVLAFSGTYADAAYLVAAHCDEIWLDPMGYVALPGPGTSQPYYKGLIDKLGATIHVYRVGKYKSFVEPYTRTEASPEAKAADQALLDALWADWQANVHAARPQAVLADYIKAPLTRVAAVHGDLAAAARDARMVDGIATRYDFGDHVAKLVGHDDATKPGDFRGIRWSDWLAANPASHRGAAVAVVTVSGEIVDGKSRGVQAGGTTIADDIERATADGRVRAIVLRVDSPGGSVDASERIRLALVEARKKQLPVIASMGGIAASGGYWISTASDRVLAEPATITGSIGVFGIIPTFEKSLAKLGISHDGVATTPLSGQPDAIGGTTPQVDQLIQSTIDQTYQRFIGLVSAARDLPTAQVDAIAQGRVWDGATARKLNLVDGYGTLEDALAAAAKAAKLDPNDVYPLYMDVHSTWLTDVLAGLKPPEEDAQVDALTAYAQAHTVSLDRILDDSRALLDGPVVQARCLSCPAPRVTTRHQSSRLGRLFGAFGS